MALAPITEHNELLPFSTYPKSESKLLEKLGGSNSRHEYGLKYIQKTRQHCCAYCEADLTSNFEVWLTMALDHAVPASVCKTLGIDNIWCESLANTVLACGACNGFCNKYMPSSESRPETFQQFLALRDRIFLERKDLILRKRNEERSFFDRELAPYRI